MAKNKVLWGARGFQLTAARRRLGRHSGAAESMTSFNSQPPEGGWALKSDEDART